MNTGYIYLIESYNSTGGVELEYKIGYTRNKDINKRLSQLKTGNPNQLKIVKKFESEHGQKVETSLHNIFSHKKIDGEWFRLNNEDVNNFIEICEKLESNYNTLLINNNPFV